MRALFFGSLIAVSLTTTAALAQVSGYSYRQMEVGLGASTPGVLASKELTGAWYEGFRPGTDHEFGNACLVARHPGYPGKSKPNFVVTKYRLMATVGSDATWIEPVAGAEIDAQGNVLPREAVTARQLSGLYSNNGFWAASSTSTRIPQFQSMARACTDGGFAAAAQQIN